MKKRSSIALLTALLAIVFAAGIGVYSNYIGMQIYEESSNHLLESYAQISKTFTLFVQRNWVVLSQWDSLMKNMQEDADIDSIWSDAQNNKLLWHYSDFYLFNESTQYLTVDGRKGSADSIDGVFQEMYSKGEPIVSTYTATYGVPKIAFAMPMSRNLTLDGVTYTGIAVSYDTDVVDDLVDGSMYGGQSDCYVVRSNGDIVLELEPQTELCEGMTNLYDLSDHVDWKYGSMDDIRDCIQLGKSGSAQFTCDGVRNYLVAIPTVFSDWSLVGVIQTDEVDGAMLSVQQSTIIALGALCIFAVIIVVLALLIFCYMGSCGIHERRFLDVAVFLLLCSLWCLTDSALYQIYGRDTAAGSVVSFYAFMLMAIPMVHFVRNTVSGRQRLVPDICIALFCANALVQGAAYRLFGIRFIDMLPLTHLLLAAGVAAMLTVLLRSYREQPSQQLRLRIAAFAALGVFGVAALVLYGLLHIYWYDAIFQFGVLLFIILLFRELLGQATEDMRFHMEHRISHQMQREDRMTGLPNRRAFEEYMERIRTGEVGCRDAVLTYIRLEGLNERNDRFGLQAGDEAVIAAARCVADFCRACEDGGESVSCFRTGGNEFALIRPEPRANSGQLHRQFSAIVARYNRTCAPRARITMTYGFSRLCDEDGKSRSISAWKAEADAYLKRNETRLGGDTE